MVCDFYVVMFALNFCFLFSLMNFQKAYVIEWPLSARFIFPHLRIYAKSGIFNVKFRFGHILSYFKSSLYINLIFMKYEISMCSEIL